MNTCSSLYDDDDFLVRLVLVLWAYLPLLIPSQRHCTDARATYIHKKTKLAKKATKIKETEEEEAKTEHRFVAAPAQSVKFMRPTRSATTHTTTTQAEVAVTVAAASTTTTTEDASPSPVEVLVASRRWSRSRSWSRNWNWGWGWRWSCKMEDEDEDEAAQPANFISRNKSMTDLCTAQSLQITNVYWMSLLCSRSFSLPSLSPSLSVSLFLCSRSKKWQWLLLLLLLSEGLQSPFSFNQRFFTRLSGSWIAFELIKILMRSLQCCKTTTTHKHKHKQAARLLRLLFATHLQLKLQKESKLYFKIPRMANNTHINMFKHVLEACSDMSRQNSASTVSLHSHCKYITASITVPP